MRADEQYSNSRLKQSVVPDELILLGVGWCVDWCMKSVVPDELLLSVSNAALPLGLRRGC